MPEPRHAKEKSTPCGVEGCSAQAERSVHGKKVEKSGLRLRSDPAKNVHLCRDHYREFKKKTKQDRLLDRLGR